MAKFRLTAAEERELKRTNVLVKDMDNCIQHQRCYYIPAEDTWTKPLPGDGPRMIRYLRKGFRLVAPDGSLGPPVETGAVAPLKAAQGKPEDYEPEARAARAAVEPSPMPQQVEPQTVVTHTARDGMLACPLCGQEQQGLTNHMQHLARHRERGKKKKRTGG